MLYHLCNVGVDWYEGAGGCVKSCKEVYSIFPTDAICLRVIVSGAMAVSRGKIAEA